MNAPAKLIEHARQAQAKSKAAYSRYRVGAAVLTRGGNIYIGCNIESGAYSTTICAERVAIFTAIAAGETDFDSLAVITADGGTPCGSCRQVIHEQCGDITIHIANNANDEVESVTIAELLPKPFTLNEH
jgi:cytidine deaminase